MLNLPDAGASRCCRRCLGSDAAKGPRRTQVSDFCRASAIAVGVASSRICAINPQNPKEAAMPEAFICDAVRTPIGRYAGALAKVRTDDLAAVPLKALMARHPKIDWTKLDEVYFGCANQAGEDNRNVARMALLMAGPPPHPPGGAPEPASPPGLNGVGG